MEQPKWMEWKSTVLGVLALVLPLVAIFKPGFTPENQATVTTGIETLFNSGAAIVAVVTSFILIFKTTFGKK
jgi:hypothetical protein